MLDKFEKSFHVHFDALKTDHAALAVFLQLQRWARHEPGPKPDALLGIRLARGQLATTERVLMRNLGIKSRCVVQRVLKKLVRLGLIELKQSELGSLVTVLHLVERVHLRVHHETAESHEARGVQNAPVPSESTSESMKKTGVKKTVIKPLPNAQARATVSNDPAPLIGGVEEEKGDSLSQPEAEMIVYAEKKLGRVFGKAETLAFVETWRMYPWMGADELRRSIDFIASHPKARRETRSIKRAFFGKQMRAVYGDWNAAFAELVAEGLARGKGADEIAAFAVGELPSFESDAVRGWARLEIERQTA